LECANGQKDATLQAGVRGHASRRKSLNARWIAL
jgi:hypothetical protein